jgi:hypothetical protein
MIEREVAETLAVHMVEHPEGAAAGGGGLEQRRGEKRARACLMLLRTDVEIVPARTEDGVVKRRPCGLPTKHI